MSRYDYIKPWVESADVHERLHSMVKVIRLILNEQLHDDITRRLYKEVTWGATELGAKYATRYRSVKALELQQTLPVKQWWGQVTHEHVWPRSELRKRLELCRTDDEILRVLSSAQGCVIQRGEHRLLDETKTGWLRYLGQVGVVDMVDGAPADLRALAHASG